MGECTVNYEVGDIVETDMSDGTRLVSVTEKRERIKNGRPGFVGVLVSASTPEEWKIGDGVWGYDFQVISVLRLSEKSRKDDWEPVGVIGVDSGMCWLGDPCHVIHRDEPQSDLGDNWEEFVHTASGRETHQFNYSWGGRGLGISVRTGAGDGVYPVEVRRSDSGMIAEVRVVFLPE